MLQDSLSNAFAQNLAENLQKMLEIREKKKGVIVSLIKEFVV
jgi:hypothetical protein